MKPVGRYVSWACVAVCVVVVLSSWLRARPELTEQDALDFTREALVDAGFSSVSVAPPAVQDTQSNPDGDLPVWRTRATVEGGAVELAVRRDLGQAVFVRDISDDGDPLLTDTQFARLDDFQTDPAVDRRIADNIQITAAAVLAGLVAAALAASTAWGGRPAAVEASAAGIGSTGARPAAPAGVSSEGLASPRPTGDGSGGRRRAPLVAGGRSPITAGEAASAAPRRDPAAASDDDAPGPSPTTGERRRRSGPVTDHREPDPATTARPRRERPLSTDRR